MKIKILTNHVTKGWEPHEIAFFLGGSEEVVVELATQFSRFYETEVYHTKIEGSENIPTIYKNVAYYDRQYLRTESSDILIVCKEPNFRHFIQENPKQIIYWSSDVEMPFNLSGVSCFRALTPYHASRLYWVPNSLLKVIPQGIDMESLTKNKEIRNENLMLYSSSPDRGLTQLLRDWKKIKVCNPYLKLNITYGFNSLVKFLGTYSRELILELEKLADQEDITFLGQVDKNIIEKLYWMSKYWCLPLNFPDAELFCLNAIKARYTGCIPVVNMLGALNNTVDKYIDYSSFVKGDDTLRSNVKTITKVLDWQEVIHEWLKLIKA